MGRNAVPLMRALPSGRLNALRNGGGGTHTDPYVQIMNNEISQNLEMTQFSMPHHMFSTVLWLSFVLDDDAAKIPEVSRVRGSCYFRQ